MLKTLTPHTITLIIAIVTSILCGVLYLGHSYTSGITVSYLRLLLSLLALITVLYALIRFLLQRYIYRRILPIYKIVRTREFKKKQKLDVEEFNKDILGELDGEVTKWADEQSKELETMKVLESYRKNYLGNISHELKTPLFSVQGYIHTLLEGVEDPQIRTKFLKRAADNTDRLIRIVDDLEMITKIESQQQHFESTKFNVKNLVEEVFEDLHFQAEDQKVELAFMASDLDNYIVHADREAIRQVLNNLIVNSIKYGNKRGKTQVGFFDMEKHILVEVSDNGNGIEQEHLSHLFDRFYRIDESRNRKIGGSGLGLSIVKHIIEGHDQKITVRSTVGKGTTFSFTLPKK